MEPLSICGVSYLKTLSTLFSPLLPLPGLSQGLEYH